MYSFLSWIIEEEDDGYDGIEEVMGDIRDHGDIYGDPLEDMDLKVINNPYYGDDIEMSTPEKNNTNRNINLEDTKIVKTTHNVYYEM